MVLLLLLLPVAALPVLWCLKTTKALYGVSVLTSAMLLATGLFLTARVSAEGSVVSNFPLAFYVDSLSALILDIMLVIQFLVSIYSIGYLNGEKHHGSFNTRRIKLFYMLFYGFIFTMVLALTAANMGIMWIAIEGTTLSSVFLVGFHNDKKSIEAAWKYVILCSVGIALAMLGVVFLHLSSAGIVQGTGMELSWPYLVAHASSLKEPALRLSFLFILVGYGTKAGLAPMHTWLPDAHSQAPSPISAMLSGVLLNTALYGILRELAIVNRGIGQAFAGRLMLTAGLLSMLTAAVFIMTQKDYKRLLAYSSIEHMGLISIGFGVFTPAAVLASLMHMINHSFTKSMLFLTSGNVLQKYGTKEIYRIKGLLKTMPVTGTVFLLGIFAITGMPPFSVFSSELGVLTAAFQTLPLWVGMLTVFLLALVFVGFAAALFKIFHGYSEPKDIEPGEPNRPGAVVILILLGIILLTGVFLPKTVMGLLQDAQKIITGG